MAPDANIKVKLNLPSSTNTLKPSRFLESTAKLKIAPSQKFVEDKNTGKNTKQVEIKTQNFKTLLVLLGTLQSIT
jgi:hypothetical protein